MTAVGVADHYGWAVLVVVGADGRVIERRRAELVASSLPVAPFEHEAQSLPPDDAVALIRAVEHSIREHAAALWSDVAAIHGDVAVAIRESLPLPADICEQIRSYHARTRADGAMYRRLLAEDAVARGWEVRFYNQRTVEDEAISQLGISRKALSAPRDSLSPPWNADHRRSFAAALLALGP
jgi:hypothetical protein